MLFSYKYDVGYKSGHCTRKIRKMNEVEEVQYIFVLIFHDCVPLNVFKKALTYITCNAFLSLYSAGPQYAAVVQYVLILALAVVLCGGKFYHYLCHLLAQISSQLQEDMK